VAVKSIVVETLVFDVDVDVGEVVPPRAVLEDSVVLLFFCSAFAVLASCFVAFTSVFATLTSAFAGLTVFPTEAFAWAPVVFTVDFAFEFFGAELFMVGAFTVALFVEAFPIEALAVAP
jgi:hypothetical protein